MNVAPTAAQVSEVRKLIRGLATGLKVRKGTGSVKHAILVRGPQDSTPEERISVCEALIAAGYESVNAQISQDMSLRDHHIYLAREWDHYLINLSVAKVS